MTNMNETGANINDTEDEVLILRLKNPYKEDSDKLGLLKQSNSHIYHQSHVTSKQTNIEKEISKVGRNYLTEGNQLKVSNDK